MSKRLLSAVSRKWAWCVYILAGAALFIVSSSGSAWAQAPNPFGNAPQRLWEIGEQLILLGRGGMLLGGGWSILAAMGKIGYFSAAVTVFAGGLFLANLPKLVDFLIPAG